jgi:hypothetical protein
MTHQINSEEWRFNTNKHGGSREFRFDAYISSRITTVIQVVRDYQINYNWYNEPSAVSIKYLILTHAWLNLWDERMTTGRINQVATCTRGFIAAKDRSFIKPLASELPKSLCFPLVTLLPIELAFKHSVSPEINLQKQQTSILVGYVASPCLFANSFECIAPRGGVALGSLPPGLNARYWKKCVSSANQ